MRTADAAHERYFRDAASLFGSVLSFADTALRGSAILNGGAAVATLAFIGALVTAQTPRQLDYSPLGTILSVFGVGVLLSTVAGGISYLAQWFYSSAHQDCELKWDHPYVEATAKSRSLNAVGAGFHILAVILVFGSYFAFADGGLRFRDFATVALVPSIQHAAHSVTPPETGVPATRAAGSH